MADEIVYVTVSDSIVEIVEVETDTPEPIIVDVRVNEVFNGVSYNQEVEPDAPELGNTWFKPSTSELFVRQAGYWQSPGIKIVDGVVLSRATSVGDRMWEVQVDSAIYNLPVVDRLLFKVGQTVKVVDFGSGPALIIASVGSPEELPYVGPWVDLELMNGFIPSPGLQHPQWRKEGDLGRFRGHYQHPSTTVRQAFAKLPIGYDSFGLNHLFCGIGKTTGGTQTIARWDAQKSPGVLYADNQYSINHTFPMSMNTRYIIYGGDHGQTTSPWTTYGNPWAGPTGKNDSGRILAAGLLKSGAAGTSQIWRFPYTAGEQRAAGGDWIMASCDANGALRLDVKSATDEIHAVDTINSSYATLEGIEWVASNSEWKFTALPMVNGWVNYGPPYAGAARALFGDAVYLRGLVRSGTAGATIATLPVGYRPPAKMIFPVQNGGSVNRQLSIDVDGTIKQEAGHNGNGWVSICVNFSTSK